MGANGIYGLSGSGLDIESLVNGNDEQAESVR